MFSETLQDRLRDAIISSPLDPQRRQVLISKIRHISNRDYLHVLSFIELMVLDDIIGNKIENASEGGRSENARSWEKLERLYKDCKENHFKNKPFEQAQKELFDESMKIFNQYLDVSVNHHWEQRKAAIHASFSNTPGMQK